MRIPTWVLRILEAFRVWGLAIWSFGVWVEGFLSLGAFRVLDL